MILEPINDNVIIKLPEVEKEIKSKMGIVIASNNSGQAKPDRGIVVAVGTGRRTASGELIKLTVKAGDDVIFNRFAGSEIQQGENRYLILKETDILTRIK